MQGSANLFFARAFKRQHNSTAIQIVEVFHTEQLYFYLSQGSRAVRHALIGHCRTIILDQRISEYIIARGRTREDDKISS